MADNYLENKMEEHRRRAGASPAYTARRSPAGARAGTVNLPFPPLTALLLSAGDISADALARSVLRSLTAAGCSVAFTGTDLRRGQLTAQSDGGQFHRIADGSDLDALDRAMARVAEVRGAFGMIINCGAPQLYARAAASAYASPQCLKINIACDGGDTRRLFPDEILIQPADGSTSAETFAAAAGRLALYLALPDSTALLRGRSISILPDGRPV